MVTQEIKEYLNTWYNETNNTTYEYTDADSLEILIESGKDEIEVDRSSHRWWDEVTRIAKYGDKYFEYTWAKANRDESVTDLGWEFNWASVHEVEPYTETVLVTKWQSVS
jgi:hypothetical protein